MPRFKPYDYSQLQMIPVALTDQLLPGTLEAAIHYLVEQRLDLSLFHARYDNDQMGCRAYDPKVLLKVILLGYARGLLSSRRLERAGEGDRAMAVVLPGAQPGETGEVRELVELRAVRSTAPRRPRPTVAPADSVLHSHKTKSRIRL